MTAQDMAVTHQQWKEAGATDALAQLLSRTVAEMQRERSLPEKRPHEGLLAIVTAAGSAAVCLAALFSAFAWFVTADKDLERQVADVRTELVRIEAAQGGRLDRLEAEVAENRALLMENRALLMENRALLLKLLERQGGD